MIATLYVAGPMSYHPQFNLPMFFRVAGWLRKEGWRVINPAELDGWEVVFAGLESEKGELEDLPYSVTWGTFLARDVKAVADDADGIVLLPGWATSRGARLEALTAHLCRKTIYEWEESEPNIVRIDPDYYPAFLNKIIWQE